ncbi:hypothetical protein BGX26_000394 [Mortierella sp. AD094]|nr:hypothetical protein BGX26_000394 [Mortierella sp. AD094]
MRTNSNNAKFRLPSLAACAIAFRAKATPSPATKVFSIPELIDRVLRVVIIDLYSDLKKSQETIRQLRLVSRAFFQTANRYFIVYLSNSPFQTFRGYESKIKLQERIRVCGPYIHSIDLRAGHFFDPELMDLIGDCCPSVRYVTLSFQGPVQNVPHPDYPALLKKWSALVSSSVDSDDCIINTHNIDINGLNNFNSLNDLNNFNSLNDLVFAFCKIKSLTAILHVNGRLNGEFEINESFDYIRLYMLAVELLTVEVEIENPTGGNPVYTSDKPLSWQSFQGFFQSLPMLSTFSINGISSRWSQMPTAAAIISGEGYGPISFPNLTKLSLNSGKLDLPTKKLPFVTLSIVRKLNLMFPNLEYLAIHRLAPERNQHGSEFDEHGKASLSVKMTVKRMQIQVVNMRELHKLLKVAPKLKDLTCNETYQLDGLPQDLKPFGDRIWDYFEIDGVPVYGFDVNVALERYSSTAVLLP